jgi:hypothetical protein
MQYRCCLNTLRECSPSRALLHGHGHAGTDEHLRKVERPVTVLLDYAEDDIELEALWAGGPAHALEVACACSRRGGRESGQREPPSGRRRGNRAHTVTGCEVDGPLHDVGRVRQCAVDLSRALRNEDGVVLVVSGGRDIDMAGPLSTTDRCEIALEARFRMGDAHEGKYYERH